MLWLVLPQVQGYVVGLKLEYQEYLPKAPVFKALASACGIIWEMCQRRSLMREGWITGSMCWKWMLAYGFSATTSLFLRCHRVTSLLRSVPTLRCLYQSSPSAGVHTVSGSHCESQHTFSSQQFFTQGVLSQGCKAD